VRTETLTESQPSKPFPLSREQRESLDRLGKSLQGRKSRWFFKEDHETNPIFCQPASDGNFEVTVRNAVGIISINGLDIVVEPKIPLNHLAYLLNESNYFPRLDFARSLIQEGHSFWELIARMFLKQLKPIIRDGLLNSYSWQEDDLSVVKGKLQPIPTYISLLSGQVRIRAEFEDFTIDSPANRVLKSAATRISSSTSISSEQRKQARLLINQMSSVSQVKSDDLFSLHEPRDSRYRQAMQLARMILGGDSFTLASGNVSGWSFLIPTPAPVEEGIRNLLRTALVDQCSVEKESISLNPSWISMNPDIVFGSPVFATADVKYSFAKEHWKRTDLYQAISFAEAFQVEMALVIGFIDEIRMATPSSVGVGCKTVAYVSWDAKPTTDPVTAAKNLIDSVRERLALKVINV
jgi:5-methylcytosine-specific restriction enzyme subunit McrC